MVILPMSSQIYNFWKLGLVDKSYPCDPKFLSVSLYLSWFLRLYFQSKIINGLIRNTFFGAKHLTKICKFWSVISFSWMPEYAAKMCKDLKFLVHAVKSYLSFEKILPPPHPPSQQTGFLGSTHASQWVLNNTNLFLFF